ncbi:hypothetical protein [Flexithrix dorotheae]|uniref:hypothetical protein n=1 Tax=Flexithrix dorotheae TaxID=70993 RepID=UPI000381E41B|nr:hypothetical protein [Flexithrix dorotheae]
MALAGWSGTYMTYFLAELPVNPHIPLLVGMATLADYNIPPVHQIGLKKTFQLAGIRTLPQIKVLFFILSIPVSGFLLIQLNFVQVIFFLHLGIISVWYALPIKFLGKSLPPLRMINFLKIFLIVYVWVGSIYFLPLLGEVEIGKGEIIGGLERALFFFGITLPFDIRDFYVDQEVNLKTIPHKTGFKRAKILALVSLIAGLSLVFWNYDPPLQTGFIISYLLTIGIVFGASLDKRGLYFTGLIDGTIIIQAGLIYLALFI